MFSDDTQATYGDARIDTNVLAVLIRSGIPMVLLDARTGESDDGRRIPGASKLGPKSAPAELESVIGPENALVVSYSNNLYCPESMRLCRHLAHNGYHNVLDYLDGLAGWVAAGHEVVQAGAPRGPGKKVNQV